MMPSSKSLNSGGGKTLLPIETFRPSGDYSRFESEVIRPFIRSSRAHSDLFNQSQLPVSFAPGRPSIEDMRKFLEETDYNHSISHPLPSASNGSSLPGYVIPLVGYISSKQPDCFVWEAGHFKKGAKVMLGRSGRLARVLGFGGIGRNYVMMKLEELGRNCEGEPPIICMVVSAHPNKTWLVALQFVSSFLFKRFLGSMRDFMDEDETSDEMSEHLGFFGGLGDSVGALTSSTEIQCMGEVDFVEGEGASN